MKKFIKKILRHGLLTALEDWHRERKLKRYIQLARSVDLPPLYIPREDKDDCRGC